MNAIFDFLRMLELIGSGLIVVLLLVLFSASIVGTIAAIKTILTSERDPEP